MYSGSLNIQLLHRFGSSKSRKGSFIFVNPQRVASWQRLKAQIIILCLQGEGNLVLPLFLPLIFRSVYGMLTDDVLCCNLQRLKVSRWLCCPDLQLCNVLWYFTCRKIMRESPPTTARFVVICVFANTSFKDQMRKYTQCCATDPIYWCP